MKLFSDRLADGRLDLIAGAEHSVKQRNHARRYLAEATWRFNHRFDLAAPHQTAYISAKTPATGRAD